MPRIVNRMSCTDTVTGLELRAEIDKWGLFYGAHRATVYTV